MDDNFTRAKTLWDQWPSWKKEYQLLKSPDVTDDVSQKQARDAQQRACAQAQVDCESSVA